MDITYIPMQKGFMYLTVIIDVYIGYIVAWDILNSLDSENSLLGFEIGYSQTWKAKNNKFRSGELVYLPIMDRICRKRKHPNKHG